MLNIFKKELFHKFIRWSLGLHGVIHLAEFLVNILEGAYWSSLISLFGAFVMVMGAWIDFDHHGEESKKE